jgi:electron transfer flavoprotein alpha subunit
MMSGKRIDPRRPYRTMPNGLRRIVLGETGAADLSAGVGTPALAVQAKPLRTTATATRWHMAVAHSYRGRLDDHAREAIAAATILASSETGVIAVILGTFHEDAAALGADKVIVAEDLDASRFEPRREEAIVGALLDQYAPAHIFMPDNLLGDGDLGRRLIAKGRGSAAARVAEIDANHVAVVWSGGSALATAPLPRFVLLQPGVVDTHLPFFGAGEAVSLPEIAAVAEVSKDLGLERTEAGSIALEEADFIVSAGNGVSNVTTIDALALSLGAAVGASRVAVDDGKFPRSKQIGASGKTVGATTYLAVGISGAVQHLQGIKSCRHVIAINRDPGAPIVKRADLTIIGDAEEVMQALITRVAQARDQTETAGAGT